MDSLAKKILYINLERQTYEIKSYPDLYKYIGGVGIGLRLYLTYRELDPIVFSIGPFNGFFPYASKTAVVLSNNGVVEDMYLGGALSSRIRFAGLDAIIITGTSKSPVLLDILDEKVLFRSGDSLLESLGLPGKKCVLNFSKEGLLVDNYFGSIEPFLERKFYEKKILSLVLTGSKSFNLKNRTKYTKMFRELLMRNTEITVNNGLNPSCVGCPMGCDLSKSGEIGGNVLLHSLCACKYADLIYADISLIFSCLNILGYDYSHEDIESLPGLIKETLQILND